MMLGRAKAGHIGTTVFYKSGDEWVEAKVIDVIQTDGWNNPTQDFDYKLKLSTGVTLHWSHCRDFIPGRS
jgi:hypothetical protein